VQALNYKNKFLAPEILAKDLPNRITLDKKLMQMQCLWVKKPSILNN
jgi:hypothetical protein